MDIIVCIKQIPETAEEEIVIDESGKRIKMEDLIFDINEWDDYALEEAILLKERFGGSVTVLTVGPEDSENTLRKCLARGADRAMRLTDKAFDGSDAYAVAKILYRALKDLSFNLILTGAQAGDESRFCGQGTRTEGPCAVYDTGPRRFKRFSLLQRRLGSRRFAPRGAGQALWLHSRGHNLPIDS